VEGSEFLMALCRSRSVFRDLVQRPSDARLIVEVGDMAEMTFLFLGSTGKMIAPTLLSSVVLLVKTRWFPSSRF